MNKINIGLIGYGVVGQGVVKWLKGRKSFLQNKFQTNFVLKTICDRSIHKKNTRGLGTTKLTKNINDILNDKSIDVVIELIGGLNPAKKIVVRALKNGKHVITANKALIANDGKELFALANQYSTRLYFESAVGAGIPIIKTLSEGTAGNKFKSLYGIINGTCNFILDEMTNNHCSFEEALKDAQKRGYAESDPTLDINGKDSAHKLAILVYLAFGKFLNVNDIYCEGISQISHVDIEHAESLDLKIKLLAIAKKEGNAIEARVHPTLIPKEHPLSAIHGIFNALYLEADPLGDVLLSGEGAGQMAAASGVISDLITLASQGSGGRNLSNLHSEAKNVTTRKIDQILTRFYVRFMAVDKPGALSKITGLLGQYGVGINSVTQKAHTHAATVPVIMLTDDTSEKSLRAALNKIQKLPIIKGKPVAIRMEEV